MFSHQKCYRTELDYRLNYLLKFQCFQINKPINILIYNNVIFTKYFDKLFSVFRTTNKNENIMIAYLYCIRYSLG